MRLAWGWLAALLVAGGCSSSQSRADAGQIQTDSAGVDLAPPPVDATGSNEAIPPGGFITGDVDGVTIRAEVGAVAFWYDGLQPGWIEAAAHTADWTWGLAFLNTTGAKVGCSGGNVLLITITGAGMTSATYFSGGSCTTDEVTHPAPNVGDWLDGTFTATLVTMDGSTKHTVTNGAFHVPRIADQ
jgi:hypothetical protein